MKIVIATIALLLATGAAAKEGLLWAMCIQLATTTEARYS